MAAFNPKPWFKQPAGIEFNLKSKIIPYFVEIDKDIPNFLPKTFTSENKDGIYYENISYSYEIFNGVIVWGLINYPRLHKFFMNDLKIYGPKVSFDQDVFKPLNPVNEFLLLKDIRKKTMPYHKLSISQKRINNLLVDYEYAVDKVKDDILSVCRKKKTNRYGVKSYDPTIIEYNREYIEKLKGKSKKKKKKLTKKKDKKKKKKGSSKAPLKVLYFYKDNCKWCTKFNKTWSLLKKVLINESVSFMKINGPENPRLSSKYKIKIYPTILKIEHGKPVYFESDTRTVNTLKDFIKE
jgi:hypothetical protein